MIFSEVCKFEFYALLFSCRFLSGNSAWENAFTFWIKCLDVLIKTSKRF